jgi:hypothetical protein
MPSSRLQCCGQRPRHNATAGKLASAIIRQDAFVRTELRAQAAVRDALQLRMGAALAMWAARLKELSARQDVQPVSPAATV